MPFIAYVGIFLRKKLIRPKFVLKDLKSKFPNVRVGTYYHMGNFNIFCKIRTLGNTQHAKPHFKIDDIEGIEKQTETMISLEERHK